MSRECNTCHQPIKGLDYAGRCEDCFAEDMNHAVGDWGHLSLAEQVKYNAVRLGAVCSQTTAGVWKQRGRIMRATK